MDIQGVGMMLSQLRNYCTKLCPIKTINYLLLYYVLPRFGGPREKKEARERFFNGSFTMI